MSLLLALFAAICGFVGAYYWFRSSTISAVPTWFDPSRPNAISEPVDPNQSQAGWIAGLLQASQQSAKLNKMGALWSALAALFGGMSALAIGFG